MSILAAQCRAARSLLNWSQDDLSKAAKVGRATLANFESEKSTPYERTLRDIQEAFQNAGIVFISEGVVSPGYGVALNPEAA